MSFSLRRSARVMVAAFLLITLCPLLTLGTMESVLPNVEGDSALALYSVAGSADPVLVRSFTQTELEALGSARAVYSYLFADEYCYDWAYGVELDKLFAGAGLDSTKISGYSFTRKVVEIASPTGTEPTPPSIYTWPPSVGYFYPKMGECVYIDPITLTLKAGSGWDTGAVAVKPMIAISDNPHTFQLGYRVTEDYEVYYGAMTAERQYSYLHGQSTILETSVTGPVSQINRIYVYLSSEEPTPSATATPTGTEKASPTPTATGGATATPTATGGEPTGVPTDAPTAGPTAVTTDVPTSTPTGTGTASPNPSNTASPSPTVTATATASPTPTPTSTPNPSPSPTDTPTPSPTRTPTPSPTKTPTPRPTKTPTPRPTARRTTLPTRRPTAKPTAKPTASPTPTPTLTPVPTATPTPTDTPTPEPTFTPEPTAEPMLEPEEPKYVVLSREQWEQWKAGGVVPDNPKQSGNPPNASPPAGGASSPTTPPVDVRAKMNRFEILGLSLGMIVSVSLGVAYEILQYSKERYR